MRTWNQTIGTIRLVDSNRFTDETFFAVLAFEFKSLHFQYGFSHLISILRNPLLARTFVHFLGFDANLANVMKIRTLVPSRLTRLWKSLTHLTDQILNYFVHRFIKFLKIERFSRRHFDFPDFSGILFSVSEFLFCSVYSVFGSQF